MGESLGYAAAIVVAAAALRRLPVEWCRWRAQRRARGLVAPGAGATPPPAPPAGRRGASGWLGRALEAAGVPLGVPQAALVWLSLVVIGSLVGVVLGSATLAWVGAVAGCAGPPLALRAWRRRRSQLVADALPDYLERAARSLRAGVSTPLAMDEARPADGPLAGDLAEVMADVSGGRSLAEALEGWHRRCPLPEVNLATAALSMGAASGGRRAPAVEGVAATLRDSRAARQELGALALQGRLSALLVALLPLGFLVLSTLVGAGTVDVLYRTPLGLACLAAGVGLNAAGFVWMHRITRLP